MNQYILRTRDELLEELRILGMKKKKTEDEYKIAMADIIADAEIIKSELALLKSLGKY